MSLWKVRLQSQCFVRIETRLFSAGWSRLEFVIYPALRHREPCKSGCKLRIELDSLLEKFLGLQRILTETIGPASVVVRLNVQQVGIRILCRPTVKSCPFVGRKLGLKR